MRTLLSFLRHWRKVATLGLVVACGVAYAASPLVHDRTYARTWGRRCSSAGRNSMFWNLDESSSLSLKRRLRC
jgi:hypothetical protein